MIWLLLMFLTPADSRMAALMPSFPICDSTDIKAYLELPLQSQNQYTLKVFTEIPSFSRMILRFDSEVSLELVEPMPMDAQISKFPGSSDRSYQYLVIFTDKTSTLGIKVSGPASGLNIPHVRSVNLNNMELCADPKTGYLDDEIKRFVEISSAIKSLNSKDLNSSEVIESEFEETATKTRYKDESCGRRNVLHNKRIIDGLPTQPGDWPWHVAILRLKNSIFQYICGGTLLSKTLVLTAAHCVTISGTPVIKDSLVVNLGRYYLNGGNKVMEKKVFKVIVHPEFDLRLNNDIALLQLETEADFGDYIQPACLWHPTLPTKADFGTVVGWGLKHSYNNDLSSTLQHITIPIVSELTCYKSNHAFFVNKLDTNQFCAGFANGTSACNGDSGGGLMIFVPDRAGDTGKASGVWYVRGIVSSSPNLPNTNVCDPDQYTIFTDVDKYRDWVMMYLN